jgi:hypothetical protein
MSARRQRRGVPDAGPPLDRLAALSSVEEAIEHGLDDSCRDAALRVLASMWEGDVTQLCGPRWRPKQGVRVARAGACRSDVTLAGRRIQVKRPRVRSEDREIELPTYRFVSARDVLDRKAIAAVVASVCGVGTPAGGDAVTRRFLDSVAHELRSALSQPGPHFSSSLLLGGVTFRDHAVLVALGFAPGGASRLLALQAGSPENGSATAALLRDVSSRTDSRAPALLAVGEAPTLAAVARRAYTSVPVYRCPTEKRRRVVALLPADLQAGALDALHAAYQLGSEPRARRALQTLARRWARAQPAAAGALRDGLAETLTLHRLRAAAPRRRPSTEPRRPPPRPRA